MSDDLNPIDHDLMGEELDIPKKVDLPLDDEETFEGEPLVDEEEEDDIIGALDEEDSYSEYAY
jgi:hypothetical protein